MRLILSVFALTALLSLPLGAQEAKTNSPVKISATQAKEHIGSEAVVTGKIVEVSVAEKLVRLNFEKPYPGQPFTAIVFASKTNLFPDLEKLKGKSVEVSGRIVDFRDRPQIVLVSTNQLKVLEASSEVEKK